MCSEKSERERRRIPFDLFMVSLRDSCARVMMMESEKYWQRRSGEAMRWHSKGGKILIFIFKFNQIFFTSRRHLRVAEIRENSTEKALLEHHVREISFFSSSSSGLELFEPSRRTTERSLSRRAFLQPSRIVIEIQERRACGPKRRR